MRLQIKEMLDEYNRVSGTSWTMKDLAYRVYADKDTSDITKRSRLSAINTGKKEATVSEMMWITEVLECDCFDLLP